jgi:hypothetical protein
MSDAAPNTNAGVEAFIALNAIPNGYLYTLVNISVSKRALQDDMPVMERLEILQSLEVCGLDGVWLKPEMVAAIEPMDDKGNQLVIEASRLKPGPILDVFAKHFSTFAVLNPSLFAALQMLTGCRPMGVAA